MEGNNTDIKLNKTTKPWLYCWSSRNMCRPLLLSMWISKHITDNKIYDIVEFVNII